MLQTFMPHSFLQMDGSLQQEEQARTIAESSTDNSLMRFVSAFLIDCFHQCFSLLWFLSACFGSIELFSLELDWRIESQLVSRTRFSRERGIFALAWSATGRRLAIGGALPAIAVRDIK